MPKKSAQELMDEMMKGSVSKSPRKEVEKKESKPSKELKKESNKQDKKQEEPKKTKIIEMKEESSPVKPKSVKKDNVRQVDEKVKDKSKKDTSRMISLNEHLNQVSGGFAPINLVKERNVVDLELVDRKTGKAKPIKKEIVTKPKKVVKHESESEDSDSDSDSSNDMEDNNETEEKEDPRMIAAIALKERGNQWRSGLTDRIAARWCSPQELEAFGIARPVPNDASNPYKSAAKIKEELNEVDDEDEDFSSEDESDEDDEDEGDEDDYGSEDDDKDVYVSTKSNKNKK